MPEEKRQAPQASAASMPGRDQTTPTDTQSDESASLAARVRDLEAALVAQRGAMPMSLTPTHGAGPGDEVEETWSQADQERHQAES
jgi:hypothetical protein